MNDSESGGRGTWRRSLAMTALIGLASGGIATVAQTVVSAPVSAAQAVPGHTQLPPQTARTKLPLITTGEIFDLEYIGDRVFVAGSFTSIRNNATGNATVYPQKYLASFSLTTGLVDTNFLPVVDNEIYEVEATPDGSKLYIVGRFNTVNGVVKRKIAAVNPATGATITGFTAAANNVAQSVEATNTTVYVGGQFTAVNGVPRVGLAALDAVTGAVRTNFVNDLGGGVGVNGQLATQALVLSTDETRLLVVHTGRRVANQTRYGAAIIDTTTNQLTPWRTRLWEDNLQFVGGVQRIYAGDIAPNDQYFVLTSGSGGDRPPINDTAVAFSLDDNPDAQPRWVSRLFDSVYSVAISEVAVYLGGHFNYMEAPGSKEPWPGLDNVGYGQGQGLGGYGLGDEIVTRDHVGALDPATGKAIEWNPGSDSFEGNKAMLVTPRGVIAGGDATSQGGSSVGRIAVYEFNQLPAPNPIDTTIVNPISGRVKPTGAPFTIEGMAYAPNGVASVQVEVIDRSNNQYLQDDLVTWSAVYNSINAVVATPSAASSSWSLVVSTPTSRFLRARARTVDTKKAGDPSKAEKKFETFGVGDLTPNGEVTGPTAAIISTTTFVVTGTATDDKGVVAINYSLRDQQNRYLQDDGMTMDFGFNAFRIEPDVVGALNATWSVEVTVPFEGQWTMQADAVDTAGQTDLRSAESTWVVSATAQRPAVAMTAPVTVGTTLVTMSSAPGAPLSLTGTAGDDELLHHLEINITNAATREALTSDGSWGVDAQPGWFRISPVNIGAPTYNWSYTTPFNLQQGTYVVRVRAFDNLDLFNTASTEAKLNVTVQVPGDAFPNTSLSPGGTITTQQTLMFALAGTATDDKGVSAVRVSLKENDTGLYVQPNGTSASTYATLQATVISPGATSSVWILPITLPVAGDYSVIATAYDTSNQQDPTTSGATARYLVYPGDNPPVIQQNNFAPAEATIFTEARIFVSGRVEDDQSIAKVQVAFKNSAGKYMDASGAFPSTTITWIPAFLNSPGSPGSNFSYTTPAIPVGAYTAFVRATDQHDFVTPVPTQRNVTVKTPPGNLAPVANFTASCTGLVCSFDGRVSTDENPTALTYSWSIGSTSPLASKTYAAAGTYSVTLTVKDEYGITNSITKQVTVTP